MNWVRLKCFCNLEKNQHLFFMLKLTTTQPSQWILISDCVTFPNIKYGMSVEHLMLASFALSHFSMVCSITNELPRTKSIFQLFFFSAIFLPMFQIATPTDNWITFICWKFTCTLALIPFQFCTHCCFLFYFFFPIGLEDMQKSEQLNHCEIEGLCEQASMHIYV